MRRRRRPVIRLLILIVVKWPGDRRPRRCQRLYLRFRPARRRRGYIHIVEFRFAPGTAGRKVPQFRLNLVQPGLNGVETALQSDHAERHDQKRQPKEQRWQ
jgi:hypothetical protein